VPGFGDCNGQGVDGCEVDTNTSALHCGGCGRPCGAVPNGSAACVGGACRVGSCAGTFRDCNGSPGDGCEVDTASSNAHCGACNNACGSGLTCRAGACVTATEFRQGFSQGVSSPTQCNAWNTFRAQLTGTYSQISISDGTGFTCTGPSANTLCQALRNNTAVTVSCNGLTWVTGSCGSGLELTAGIGSGVCGCDARATVRPCIGNENWGGVGTNTCSAPSQTLVVRCQ
jgi:hypothetical protein